MFSKFTRETDTRINNVRGSGLGLAIVKELVDLMKGDIEVNSSVGRGTSITITVEVPFIIKDDLWTGDRDYATDITSVCSGMHLLVAEDNELNYEVISELLGMNGISCEGQKTVQYVWTNSKPQPLALTTESLWIFRCLLWTASRHPVP